MSVYNSSSVCYAVPAAGQEELIFVYEPYPYDMNGFQKEDTFNVYLITEGGGTLETEHMVLSLSEGSLFFLFPNTLYKVRFRKGTKLFYIRSCGERLVEEVRAAGITETRFAFEAGAGTAEKWKNAYEEVRHCTKPAFLLKGLLYETIAHSDAEAGEEGQTVLLNDARSLREAIRDYIQGHLSEPDLSLKTIADVFHFHYHYASGLFKKMNGTTFSSFVRQARMEKACELFRETSLNIRSVAENVGYDNQLYFNKIFRKTYGISPSEYRAGILKKDPYAACYPEHI